MSMDRSLKMKGALTRHRNVLSRAERIEKLIEEERWEEEDGVTALPKVAHRKSHSGKKSADEKEEGEGTEAVEGAEGTEAATTDEAKS